MFLKEQSITDGKKKITNLRLIVLRLVNSASEQMFAIFLEGIFNAVILEKSYSVSDRDIKNIQIAEERGQ